MNLNFNGQVIVVTGSARGIGRAIAEAFLRRGARVIMTGRGKKPVWCSKFVKAEYHVVDFLDEGSFARFLSCLEGLLRLDVLVNNAGMHIPEDILGVSDEDWGRILRVNLEAPMRLMRFAAKMMKKKRQGRIVNIASIAGLVSKPSSIAYSASKSGLIGLTRAAALRLASDGVLVNALCPGYTATEMMDGLVSRKTQARLRKTVALGRFAEPVDIAHMALFMASPLNTYMTGQTVVVDGGVTAQ